MAGPYFDNSRAHEKSNPANPREGLEVADARDPRRLDYPRALTQG